MRVILLGPPGSGKGTQGDLIGKEYGFPRISTGDILRQAVSRKTALGLQAEAQMKAGHLVSDDIVASLVAERIKQPDCLSGYVLDGFPRTINQVKLLEQMESGRPELALEFTLSEEVLISRLTSRRVCVNCGAVYNLISSPPRKEGTCDRCGHPLKTREDDRPEIIRERLRVYEAEIREVKEHYRRKGVLSVIESSGLPEEIFSRVRQVLEASLSRASKIDRRMAPR